MRPIFTTLLVLVLSASTIFSQNIISNHAPQKVAQTMGEQAERFQPPTANGSLVETLDQVFDSITALSPVKGFNAAMLLPDGTIWKRAKGLAEELPTQVPLTTEHLMGMGSISKSFVSTTLLLLHDDGLLDLGDSIGQYVGPYPNVPGNVTIRQLLSHRSGISDYLNENPAMFGAFNAHLDSIWVMDTILNNYVLSPNFPVGASWSYSNTNYLLAGRIIESITGQPWHEVVRQRLLDPLGLSHTFVYPFETPGSQPFSHFWADLDGNGTVEDWQGIGLPDAGLFSLATSAGCLISTPEDLVKFSEWVYGGHLLQPATLAEMLTDYISVPGAGLQYGLGAGNFGLPQNLENWGHNGDLIYKSFALYFPSENMSLAVQQNDDREYDPTQANPVLDLYNVYLALLDAYLNYMPPSASDEAFSTGKLVVTPNPAADFFTLKISHDSGLALPLPCHLTDANGRVVLTQILASDATDIPVSHLPTGLYLLRVGGFSTKIVKP